MSDTPQTNHIENNLGNAAHPALLSFCRKLERERDSWKKAHDNQVKLKRIISDRPDLKERAKLVAELIEERDRWANLWADLSRSCIKDIAALERERDGWREAAYALGEALPPSWETLQPPAEQLRKFKEMVALENEKTKKLLDNADKHSKHYP